MPAYNASITIEASVRSLQSQSYINWELLVADDSSSDDTASIVAKLAKSDSRIHLIAMTQNSGGPAIPRNVATRHARGEYIAFLDADDQWFPEKLLEHVNFMKTMGAALSCTGYKVEDTNKKYCGSLNPPAILSYVDLLKVNNIGCLTAMYDARILGKRYFPVCGNEDYALWLSILREGFKAYGLRKCLACYRLSPGSVSSNKIRLIPFFWNIYRNRENFSFFVSIFFCLRYAWNIKAKYKNNISTQP